MQHNWIFQLKTHLSRSQRAQLLRDLVVLMEEWESHGAPVPGVAEIRYDRFILVKARPGTTSGCSIDSMSQGVDKILTKNGAELLPNNFIYFRNSEGVLDYIDFRDVRGAIESGDLHPESTVYDSTFGQTNDLSRWEVSLKNCWLARFLPKVSQS